MSAENEIKSLLQEILCGLRATYSDLRKLSEQVQVHQETLLQLLEEDLSDDEEEKMELCAPASKKMKVD